MAKYFTVRRIADDETTSEYVFGISEQRLGRLRLDKTTGESTLLEELPGDEKHIIYRKAAQKLKKYWSFGELPEENWWAG